MRNSLKRIVDGFRAYYDRLLALLILVALLASLAWLGMSVTRTKAQQERFRQELAAMRIRHPDVTPADRAVFEKALQSFREPLQLDASKWSAKLMVPELRFSCRDCGRPVPFNATACPFCRALVEAINPMGDKDKDGIPDEWETRHGLNPLDATDAVRDNDQDGFSNIEEYRADTDPNSAESHPSLLTKLAVVDIKPLSFALKFVGVSVSGAGASKRQIFQLNMGEGGGRTFWGELGQTIEGYKILSHEFKERKEGYRTIDESILRMQAPEGGAPIELVKNQKYPREQFLARFHFAMDNQDHETKLGGDLDLKGMKYRVKEVDMAQRRVLMHNLLSGKDTWVGGQPPSGKREDEVSL